MALAICVWCGSARAEEPTYAWESEDAPNGMRMFTSAVRRHAYDAVKVTINVSANAARVLEILQAFEAYTQWYHRAAEVRVLQRPPVRARVDSRADGSFESVPDLGAWTLFFRQHAPPLDDRWTLLRAKFRAGSGGSLFIEFHTVQQPFTAPADAVRMDMRGYWQLTPLGAQRTEVTLMVDVDPNTTVPAFLVDPELHEAATETLAALKHKVRSKR